MESFPILYTKHLILRKIQIEDIQSLVHYANNKKISDRIVNIPYPYTEPQAVFRISYVVQGFKQKSRYVFAISRKEEGELIGEISLHLDNPKVSQLGYWVGEPFWGQGIATEAIGAVLKFGFEQLELDSVYATCHEDNLASRKVLEKHGMKEQGMKGEVITYEKMRE